MPSTRLYIDPQARAVTTKAAASAEASLMQSAVTAPAEQACSSAAAAMTDTFDVVVVAAMSVGSGGHEGIAAVSGHAGRRCSALSRRPALTRSTR